MAGLELLLVDGGATVTGLAMAGASMLGYKEHKRDQKQLASAEQVCSLEQMLRQEYASVDAGHRALTAAWQGPLSLFSSKQEQEATAHGVPAWAIDAVLKAQRLVDRAAELGDLADVYEAQLILAEKSKGVLREPVRELEQRLSSLGLMLTMHVPTLIMARDAFDSLDSPASSDDATTDGSALDRVEEAVPQLTRLQEDAFEEQFEPLPISILRDRGSLGELWGSLNSVGQHYGEALQRTLARLEGGADESAEPVELSPYVLAYT